MSPSRRKQQGADLVVVANRLPVDRVVDEQGNASWRRSPGGLVSALMPVMKANQGAWLGWPDTSCRAGRIVVEPRAP